MTVPSGEESTLVPNKKPESLTVAEKENAKRRDADVDPVALFQLADYLHMPHIAVLPIS